MIIRPDTHRMHFRPVRPSTSAQAVLEPGFLVKYVAQGMVM